MLLSLSGLSTDDQTSASSTEHRSAEDSLFVKQAADPLALSAISPYSSSRPPAADPENLIAPGIYPLDRLLTELFDDNVRQHYRSTSGRDSVPDMGTTDEPGGGNSPRWEDHLMLQQSGLYPTPLEQPLDTFFGSLNDPCPGHGLPDFPADSFLIDTLASLLPSPSFTPVQSGKDSPSASLPSAMAFDSVDYSLFDGSSSSSLASIDDAVFSSDFPLFDEETSFFKSELPSPSGSSPSVGALESDLELSQSMSRPVSSVAATVGETKITLSVSELAALIAAVKSAVRPDASDKSPSQMESDDHGTPGSQSPLSPQDKERARRRSSKLHHCPYPECTKTFSRAFNLRTHELIHEPCRDRPFNCELCAKTFVRIHDLNRHMVIHNPVRGFVCETCGKGFARSDALRRHHTMTSRCRRLASAVAEVSDL